MADCACEATSASGIGVGIGFVGLGFDGAASERVVRGGHGVIGNPEAIDEVIQVVHRSAR